MSAAGITRDRAMEKVAAFLGLFPECSGHPPHILDLLETCGCVMHIQARGTLVSLHDVYFTNYSSLGRMDHSPILSSLLEGWPIS